MQKRRQTYWNLCAALFLVLVFGAVQAFAQLDTGSLVGVVRDKSGAVITDAAVKITNTKTGKVFETKSNSTGEYNQPGLPSGPYKIEVDRNGFKTAVVTDIFLHATERRAADVNLEIGAASDQVTVTADAATVNTQSSDTGATITSTSITNLPLNGRDFTSLIALVPGAVTTGGFGQQSLGGFETDLAGVNVLLDGSDATRIDTNATSTQLGRQESRISRASIDSIQEFRVLQSTYSAEYGRSTGDVINVITKSGGNSFHGNLFEYLRNDVFDAQNYFAKQNTPLRLNQFGGNLSGPLVKNKLFFFVNYEGVRQIVNKPTPSVVIADSERSKFVAAMQPVINALPHPNSTDPVVFTDSNGVSVPRPDLGWYYSNFRNSLREDTGSVKIDWNASMKDTFAFRYNISDSFTSTQYGVATDQTSPSTSRNHLFKTTWNHTFSPTLLNEAGFALNRPQTDSLGGGGGFPLFQCSAFWGCNVHNSFGAAPGPALFSLRSPQYSLQYMDTMSWVKGRQSIRFGVDIRHNNTQRALDPQQFLSFDSLADLEAGQAFQLSTLGYTMIGVQNTNYGAFLQDDVRVTPRLTVNLGVRYEYNSVLHGDKVGNFDINTLTLQPLGAPLYNPDRNNFGPRIGFSWDPRGQGKTVVRGGFGIFYNPLLTGSVLSLGSNYQQAFSYNIFDVLNFLFGVPGARVCTPSYFLTYPVPDPLPVCNPPLASSVNGIDKNMRDTYSEHWSFGIQQQLAPSTVLELTYVGNHGVKLPAGAAYAGMELNLSPLDPNAHLLSPNYSQVRRLGNFLGSNYNALNVSVRRHVGKGLNLDANYTWSHELDNAVNILTSAFQNSRNPSGDYSSGDIDVRNNFTAGAVYDIPVAHFLPKKLGEGWQVSTLFQARSGLPVNIALSSPFLGIDQLRPNAPSGPINTSPNGAKGFFIGAGQFPVPAAGQYGTLRRNAGLGPKFAQLDFSTSKTTQISEHLAVQFRAEAFNLLNHPNFANPSGYLDDVNFGNSTSTIGNSVGVGTSRQLQFAVKLLF
jgi:hypothetical protein